MTDQTLDIQFFIEHGEPYYLESIRRMLEKGKSTGEGYAALQEVYQADPDSYSQVASEFETGGANVFIRLHKEPDFLDRCMEEAKAFMPVIAHEAVINGKTPEDIAVMLSQQLVRFAEATS